MRLVSSLIGLVHIESVLSSAPEFNCSAAWEDAGNSLRSVSGQNHPTEPDYLALSKLARATIASA